MGTQVLKNVNVLQTELEQAKSTLKHYDESIKRLIGRDPSENAAARSGYKRQISQNEESRARYNDNAYNGNTNNRQNESSSGQRQRYQNFRNQQYEGGEPPSKRRLSENSVFKRLDKPKYVEEDDLSSKLQMHSRVIVQQREIPSRQDALKAQGRDVKSKERNRRMFGALLGTLQKFQQEETKLKPKEEKRAQLEKKLEEQEILEKAKIKKERYELFMARKQKQAEIRLLEQKMLRISEQAAWEAAHTHLTGFIRTKAKPHIYYKPHKMTPKTEELLTESRVLMERKLEEKRQEVKEEIEQLEHRFENRGSTNKGEDECMEENDDLEEEVHQMLDEPVVEMETEHDSHSTDTPKENKETCKDTAESHEDNIADKTEDVKNIDKVQRIKEVDPDTDTDDSNSNEEVIEKVTTIKTEKEDSSTTKLHVPLKTESSPQKEGEEEEEKVQSSSPV